MKRKGFRETFYILQKQKDHKIEKDNFFNELNTFSYYNSFFRVKDELIEKGLIKIQQNNGSKYIELTEKGVDVYKRLKDINNIIMN